MSDLRQSVAYRKFQTSQGWSHLPLGKSFLASRRLPLWPWPVAKFQRAELPEIDTLDEIGQQFKLGMFYLEPVSLTPNQQKELKQSGYQPAKHPFLPTKTIILDLTPALTKIKAQFKKDTRYCLRKSFEHEVEIKTGSGQKIADEFYQGWRKTSGWKLLIPTRRSFRSLISSFGQNTHLQLAFNNETIIGGNLILVHQKTAYYYYAFTAPLGRKKLVQYRLIWKAIHWAKKSGYTTFDLEGIYDPTTKLKAWRGFSHFKKSFGGTEISYPGCWQKRFNPRLHK